jgi:hypothetical protein
MRVPYHKRCKTGKHEITQTIFLLPALIPLLRRAFLRAPCVGRAQFLLVRAVSMCFNLCGRWRWHWILIPAQRPLGNRARRQS